ncbi:MAG: hypothetical protein IJE78_06270 [Bacteroidaceae bacterium]|nr:hypothetical protein [Bacteroidaceae bacterium]
MMLELESALVGSLRYLVGLMKLLQRNFTWSEGRTIMASVAKKHKARNSFLYNGNEAQKVKKLKRVAYYIKADRHAGKVACREQLDSVES